MNRMQPCVKQVSVLSIVIVQIYLFLTDMFHLHELWNIMFEYQGEEKERAAKQYVTENNQTVLYI